jgi:hypothetical protein
MVPEMVRFSFFAQRVGMLRDFVKLHWPGLALMSATWAAFFCRTLSGQQLYFLDDLKIIYYPLEVAYASFQHSWSLPAWSSLFGFGQPLLGWGQLGFFTPVHVLLRALWVDPLALLQYSVIIYYALGLAGMYMFLRLRRLSSLSAGLGAILYVFCGFHIGHLNHVNFYTSSMLMPWLLVAVTRFIYQPSIRNTAWISLAAAAIAVSGQAQMVVFSFVAAAIIGFSVLIDHVRTRTAPPKYFFRLVIGLVVSGILSAAIASIAILPLSEFLPLTERAEALPDFELLDFSYVPWHTITLIFPYFFGDHASYWGAKGFQELAAFVGIIPLLLAGAAISFWKTRRTERIFAAACVIGAAVMALGRYSALYTFLVEHKYITGLGVASRFVYFFDLGIILLAAYGFEDVWQRVNVPSKAQRLFTLAASLLVPSVLLAPFIWYLPQDVHTYQRFLTLISAQWLEFLAVIIGLLAWLLVLALSRNEGAPRWPKAALAVLAAATLVIYGWNYNPLTPAKIAYTLPFAHDVAQYQTDHGYPARLYAADQLIITPENRTITKETDALSPVFTIYQPFTVYNDNLNCVRLPVEITQPAVGKVHIEVRSAMDAPALRQLTLEAPDISGDGPLPLCFDPIPDSRDKTYVLALSSDGNSNLRFFIEPNGNPDTQIFWVRKKNPTPEQIKASQKPYRLIINQQYPEVADSEAAILSRHLNVVADASSARWIGALSIRPYREFIEDFLANDREALDGDGHHVIERFRSLVNVIGITHFTQIVPRGSIDGMVQAGYILKDTFSMGDREARLYENPQAFSKAFMVRNALFKPSPDDVRATLHDKNFDPASTITVDGANPPTIPVPTSAPLQAQATITSYQPSRVEITTQSNLDAFVVLNDSYTPQWQTTIDGHNAETLVADSFMRAAYVPAGEHHVIFTYNSPAVHRAKLLSSAGLIITLLLMIPWKNYAYKKSR